MARGVVKRLRDAGFTGVTIDTCALRRSPPCAILQPVQQSLTLSLCAARVSYAHGSLRAARFLRDKKTGLYDMQDVLGLRQAAAK